VTNDDSTVELGAKVLGNTASAILQMRGQINRDMIERSIELLVAARRVEFCAVGAYAAVAYDAQYKFLRFGIPAGACTEARMQLLSVNVLGAGDVAVIISIGGRLPELLEVADRARERGAAVVAITASGSPLARKADTVIAVDHVEDSATQVPMISRILKLLVIDILTVGVAMRRPTVGSDVASASSPPGDAEATPTLAHMTQHSG
jgi:glucokinase